MLIAINLQRENDDWSKLNLYFILELFKIIVPRNPQQQFLFISDRTEDDFFSNYNNVEFIKITSSKNVLKKYTYALKCKQAVKKTDVKLVIQLNYFFDNNSIPQILLLQHLQPKLKFKKDFQNKFIVTSSEAIKNELINKFQIPEKHIDFIHFGVKKNYQALTHKEIEETKDGYTAGRNYFLFISGIHQPINLINTLKAFSIFKKRQLSNMKLVVLNCHNKISASEQEKLDTYKYKDDLVFVESDTETQVKKLMAAAYAVLFPSFQNDNYNYLIKTMQNGTAIITSDIEVFKEILGDAALYVNPNDINSIANEMQHVYKKEDVRKNKIELGFLQLQKFSWENSSNKFWSIIENRLNTRN